MLAADDFVHFFMRTNHPSRHMLHVAVDITHLVTAKYLGLSLSVRHAWPQVPYMRYTAVRRALHC